jgi:cation:H+ antiporter
MSALTLVLFIIGLGLLLTGAELLVRGASRLATTLGISPLIVGLTVVAFCTGSPEIAVSVSSALEGEADLALGNIVGSNIVNILFVLGLSALIAPLAVKMQLIKFDVPVAIFAAVLVFVLGLGGNIGRAAGLVLLALMVVYTVTLVVLARRERGDVQAEYANEFGDRPTGGAHSIRNIAFIVVGLVMLVIGSNWLVDGAVALAQTLGVRDPLIGLTVVAIGTSLPEIATSVTASIRGQRDIAVGNVIGSNIFNIFAVLGLTAVAAPGGIPVPPEMLRLEIPTMILVTLVCLPIFYLGKMVTRGEGALLFGGWVAFTLILILQASGSALADPLTTLFVVAEVSVLVVLTVLGLRARQREVTPVAGR